MAADEGVKAEPYIRCPTCGRLFKLEKVMRFTVAVEGARSLLCPYLDCEYAIPLHWSVEVVDGTV